MSKSHFFSFSIICFIFSELEQTNLYEEAISNFERELVNRSRSRSSDRPSTSYRRRPSDRATSNESIVTDGLNTFEDVKNWCRLVFDGKIFVSKFF